MTSSRSLEKRGRYLRWHNYTGYPMVKEARELVRRGELGSLMKVVVEYPQGWLINPIDEEGQKQADVF